MLDDVYNQKILSLAAEVQRRGRLPDADGSATRRAKLCGSTVIVDVKIDAGRVVDFASDVKACALGQASSSIMARHVIGATLEELRGVQDAVAAMLKPGGSLPALPEWPELAWLEPVRDFKSRHASTLLTFEATVLAFEQAIATKEATAA